MYKFNRSNRNWNRSQRRRYQDSDTDTVNFDWNRPLHNIGYEILHSISLKDVVAKNQVLAYLNLFTKYCLQRFGKSNSKINKPNDETNLNEDHIDQPTFSDQEVLSCLRVTLFHDAAEVRAASLRAIRYFVQNKDGVHYLLQLNLQHLIARSLDIVLDNRIERVQALRLLRHLLAIDPLIFPMALGRCLCAMANDNSLEKDMLLRACWATVAELTMVNAIISARSGCANVLVKSALNSAAGFATNYSASGEMGSRDRNQINNGTIGNSLSNVTGGTITNITLPYTNIAISEAILVSFLHLYNWPNTRKLLQPSGLDLFQFISPFTDVYSFLHASNAARDNNRHLNGELIDDEAKQGEEKDGKLVPHIGPNRQTSKQQQYSNYEHRTLRYLACKNAILSILRSWPGMFFMCRAIVDTHSNGKNLLFNQDKLKQDPWSYADIYQQAGEQTIRSLHDSLRFFGYEGKYLPRKVTQLVSGVGKAMDTNSYSTSSFFTTTSFDSLNPLESLVSILHLPYPEVHRHLLELIYELFGMKPPEWLESFDEALKCLYFTQMSKKLKTSSTNQQAKNYYPEEWQLYDGFVAKEAEHLLPSRSKCRLNFITNYYALLLQSLVEFGLLEALVSVVLDSKDKAAVNLATILIGELLHMSGKFLPASTYAHRCQSLPSLVAASISDCKVRRNRALSTITNLNRIHELKKKGSQPASLFLEQQLYFCRNATKTSGGAYRKPRSLSASKMQDENVIFLIKNSGVLRKNGFKDWNWNIIAEVLKHPCDVMIKLEDKDVKSFVRRLLDFYRPSSRQFSMVSKNSSLGPSDSVLSSSQNNSGVRNETMYFDNPRFLCVVATYFIDFLLIADENRVSEYIQQLVLDLDLSLKNIATKSPSADEVLIPSRLLSTLSHHYFLFLGRFTHSSIGRRWLEKTRICQYLLDLISLSTNEVYMKLIVSSLDYSEESFCRTLLSKVLTSTPESSRLYATQFMRVLLRAHAPKFNDWALELLVSQLYDHSTAVCLAALDILDEACSEDTICLEKFISHRPAIFQLGDNGIIFFTRFASIPVGLNYLHETNMLENELDRWKSQFCTRYVRIVEDSLYECFSCHQKSGSGKYGRRSDKRHFPYPKRLSMTTYLPSHLYGQLVQTTEGIHIVRHKLILEDMCSIVKSRFTSYISEDETNSQIKPDEADLLRMKAALWAIGHLASSEEGFEFVFKSPEPILFWITTLVKRALILSMRGTCFYVLCLIASTRKGAEAISEFGWIAIQHTHHEMFPINQQEYDNFYFNCRPRFMSDSEELNHSKAIVSIPSSAFLLSSGDHGTGANVTQYLSQCSSRSSSSSYLSMVATAKHKNSVSKDFEHDTRKTSFTLSSSSSTTSIYSNTSSVGCLASNVFYTTSNNRPRSSSDCVSNSVVTSNDGNSPNTANDAMPQLKPEGQDSGILDQSPNGDLVSTVGKEANKSPSRSRKISAPCFMMATNVTRENRSDSNDSARTNTTNNTGIGSSGTESISTSFAEYSTSSSASNMNDPLKIDRNLNILQETDSKVALGETPLKKLSKQGFKNYFQRRQLSVLTSNDDPYPSPVDAHGYAQLRVIQKRRVQSLSGNMFFSGINTPCALVEQLNFEKEFSSKSDSKTNRPLSSSSMKSEEQTPEIMINDSIQNHSRQRKISRVLVPPTLLDNDDSKSLLQIPSTNKLFEANDNNSSSSVNENLIQRTVSRISKSSLLSSDSSPYPGVEDLTVTDNEDQQIENDKFMCLCLPESLSLIFHLDEDSKSNAKQDSLKSADESKPKDIHSQNNPLMSSFREKRLPMDGLEMHKISNCISCCFDVSSPQIENININQVKKDIQSDVSNCSKQNNSVSLQASNNSELNNSTRSNLMSTMNTLPPCVQKRKEVLSLVANLSAAMYAKQAEQGLLSLKQRFPSVFEDFCLYSEVCLQMESCNFKATARRFLHELFLDVNLDKFYKDAEAILKKYSGHLKTANSTAVNSTNQLTVQPVSM